ncbi:MAG: hypothetical protein ACRD0L_04215 [Acidimicrobiales bacterium]
MTVTDPATVAHLVSLVDTLPVAAPGSTDTVQYELAFASSSAATPSVVATEGSCLFVDVTVSKKVEPALRDLPNEELARAIASVLGAKEPFQP